MTDGDIDQPLQDILTSTDYWTKLIVHGLSIASSLIGLSTTALDLHFRRDSKEFLGMKPATKYTLHLGYMLH